MTEIVDLEYNEKKGQFYVVVDEKKEAEMTFVFSGNDTFIIDHTEVNAGFNGQGFGKKMFLKAVAFARENNYKIIPLCPYVKSVFDKSTEYNDVLK